MYDKNTKLALMTGGKRVFFDLRLSRFLSIIVTFFNLRCLLFVDLFSPWLSGYNIAHLIYHWCKNLCRYFTPSYYLHLLRKFAALLSFPMMYIYTSLSFLICKCWSFNKGKGHLHDECISNIQTLTTKTRFVRFNLALIHF